MNQTTAPVESEELAQEMLALRGLLEVGAKLYASRDRQEMLDTILAQARLLTRAEAGTLYLVQEDRLRFVAVQNDVIDTSEIARHLLGKEVPISDESLAGFVAMTGRIMNIPDTYSLPPDAAFCIHRDFDAETGYSARSIGTYSLYLSSMR